MSPSVATPTRRPSSSTASAIPPAPRSSAAHRVADRAASRRRCRRPRALSHRAAPRGRAGTPMTDGRPAATSADDDGAHPDRRAGADATWSRTRRAQPDDGTSSPIRAPAADDRPGRDVGEGADARRRARRRRRVLTIAWRPIARAGVDDGARQDDRALADARARRDPGRGVDDRRPTGGGPVAVGGDGAAGAAVGPAEPEDDQGRSVGRRRAAEPVGEGGVVAEVRDAGIRGRVGAASGSLKPTTVQPSGRTAAASATTRACSPPPRMTSGRARHRRARGIGGLRGGLGRSPCRDDIARSARRPGRPPGPAGRPRPLARNAGSSARAERGGDRRRASAGTSMTLPSRRRPAWRSPTLTAGRSTAGASISPLELLPSIASAIRSRPQ